jgi:hypothetical protein
VNLAAPCPRVRPIVRPAAARGAHCGRCQPGRHNQPPRRLLPHLLVPVSVLHPDTAHTTVVVDLCPCPPVLLPTGTPETTNRSPAHLASALNYPGPVRFPPPPPPPPAGPWRHTPDGKVAVCRLRRSLCTSFIRRISSKQLSTSCTPLSCWERLLSRPRQQPT